MSTIPPHDSNDNPVYVYRLDDPRNEQTFYVGITVDLYQRFKQHMRCDGTNPQKDQRIQEILASGHVPLIRTVEPTKDFEQALEREQYWVQHFQNLGILLTNAQSQSCSVRKPRLISSPSHATWTPSTRRRNTVDGTRQLFELYWDECKQGQTFGDFYRDDLSDDMCADGWGYYPKHYISKKGKSHTQYRQWRREWLARHRISLGL